MSSYLEYKVKTNQNYTTIGISYHRQLGLLAILSNTENDEAQILICDELVSNYSLKQYHCVVFFLLLFSG